MLRSLCLILFLCCVLVAGALPGTGRAQTDALPHLEQIAVRGKTSVASCLDGDTMQLTNRSRVRLAESARENLPTIGEKNSPEQILCFVQYHYTKRRVAPPFFLA